MVWAEFGQTAHLESSDCTKAMPGRSVDLPSLQFMLGFVVQFVPFSGLGCVCPQLEIQLFWGLLFAVLTKSVFASSETLCLLVIDFSLILNHKEPSVSWKFLGLPRKAAPTEPPDILVTSTHFWQRSPRILLPRTATGIAISWETVHAAVFASSSRCLEGPPVLVDIDAHLTEIWIAWMPRILKTT